MPAVLTEHEQFLDASGKPYVDGKVYYGVQGADPTVSPITIYSDRELTTPITNPQVLDALGRTANKVWVAGRYSIRQDDLNDNQIYQNLDNGESADKGITVLENVSGGNTITATAATTISAYEDLEQYAGRAAQVNTDAITLNIDAVGAKPVVKNHNQPILRGEWEEDQNFIVSYNLTDDVFEWVNQNNKVVDFYEGTPVASAATTDIWATDGNTIHVTGTTTITSFGTAPNVGAWRKVVFDDALTLTDGANLNLQGSANITTAADDFAHVYAETTTLFKVLYFKADGTAVATIPDVFSGQLLHVRDEKSSGTEGGTFTLGSWQTRVLNTVKTNQITGASLASNQITLSAGDYMVSARAPGFTCASHQLKLYDTTGTADLVIGDSSDARVAANVQTKAMLDGEFTLSTESVLELQHQCADTQATNGLGQACTFGVVEVYAEVQIWKVS